MPSATVKIHVRESKILPPSKKRRSPNHLRTVKVETFECDDGTIEMEFSLVDEKRFGFRDRERGALEPGDPVHGINARISINENMEVLSIETDLAFMPFRYCQGGAHNAGALIGKRLDWGWRKSVRDALGLTSGCTHLAELLTLAPTVAFQTKAITRSDEGLQIGRNDSKREKPPFFLGGCYSWSPDSPVTKEYFPRFTTKESGSD